MRKLPRIWLITLAAIVSLTLTAPAIWADTLTPDSGDSALLGPQTSGGQGSTNADGATLQPNGSVPLQSTNNDSTSLTAPAPNALQGTAPSNTDLQVLNGEADGPPHNLAADASLSIWVDIALMIFIALAAAFGVQIIRHRQRFSRTVPTVTAAAPSAPQPNPQTHAQPSPTPTAVKPSLPAAPSRRHKKRKRH